MFVNQLLFAFTFHDYSEIVKAPDLTANLEAIEQIDYNGLFFTAHPVQETVLQIQWFVCACCHDLSLLVI